MDKKAMYQLTYGLFVLTAKEGEKDNGCIINTALQVTTAPNRVTITVNKQNYTHDMIVNTGAFNVSVLGQSAPFALFQRFGFQSGRDVDKLQGVEAERGENGIYYIKEHTTAWFGGKVVSALDLGSHTQFLADVTEGEVLSGAEAVSYAYYQKNIKPKPQAGPKKGFRCRICGYVYEGDELPADFICPICKHGASDFERIE